MAKLYRPHIPLAVRCEVAQLQLTRSMGIQMPEGTVDFPGLPAGQRLPLLLQRLARKIGCEVSELRLDHDPPLGARRRRGQGKKTVYTPAANNPDHLFYRPHGPEHEGSHLIKTNVRGDHGQHPDRVLIKKARRFERAKIDTSDIPEVGRSWFKRAKLRRPRDRPKTRWAKRPFPKRGKVQ